MRRIHYHMLPDAPVSNPNPLKKQEQQQQTALQTQPNLTASGTAKKGLAVSGLPQSMYTLLSLLLLTVFIRNKGTKSFTIQSNKPDFSPLRESMVSTLHNPQVIDMLNAVCPYLDESGQVPIHTMIGVLQTFNSIRNLQTRNFRVQGIPSKQSMSLEERQLGIIHSIKPYVHPDQQPMLEQMEKTFTTVHRLRQSLEKVQGLRNTRETTSSWDMIINMLDIFKPILPQEQQTNFDKLSRMVKLMEVMDAQETAQTDAQSDAPQSAQSLQEKETGDEKENAIEILPSQEQKQLTPEEQQEQIINALKPLMNEEQQKSMGKLLELAKSLAASSNNKRTQ